MGSSMTGPKPSPDSNLPRTEPISGPCPSRTTLSGVIGVFAGTARGARIGAGIGFCACFLVMMSYLVYDAASNRDPGMTPGAVLAALLVGAAWFGLVSVGLGGVVGAALGAMVG